MPRVMLTLEYDGTNYVGWQVQPNGVSVQAVLEQALHQFLGSPAATQVAGRTDAGVHAHGQVACFETLRDLPLVAYERGLSALLPADVVVRRARVVPAGFDPRRDALGKRYRYRISNRRGRSPLRRRTHWELFTRLSVEAMAAAAGALVGRHDFSSFRAADCDAGHPVRELKRVEVSRGMGDEVDVIGIEVEGTAFLKHMVRNVVGSLVEVGKARQPVAWMAQLLAAHDRRLAGPTAPPQGLCLMEVLYPPLDWGTDGSAQGTPAL
jgi:tRNA pseudouridine38-40 synthase